ncbi:MAG: hypothetical protein EOL93_01790 [Epsilonproteobacteria bacterium]|nr:hypothetical protein [Campylobacterota bacterium]
MEPAINLENMEMSMETGFGVDMGMEVDKSITSTIESKEPEMTDFEKMILESASRAKAVIDETAKSEPKIDVAAISAGIMSRAKSDETAIGLSAKKEKPEPKKRGPKPKTEKHVGPVGLRDAQFGEAKLREVQPVFSREIETLEDGNIRIRSNNMEYIKASVSSFKKENKGKKIFVYIESSYFYSQYHKIEMSERVYLESVGRTFLLLTYNDIKWSILPERQDESFALIVEAVEV